MICSMLCIHKSATFTPSASDHLSSYPEGEGEGEREREREEIERERERKERERERLFARKLFWKTDTK